MVSQSLRRFAHVGLFLALASALVAHSELLASNNLLPRRVGLHLAAVFALMLAAHRHAPRPWIPIALFGWSVIAWALSDARYAGLSALFDGSAALALIVALTRASLPRFHLITLLVGLITLGALLGLIDQWWVLPLGSATRPAGLFASRATAGALFAACIPLTALLAPQRPWLASVALMLLTACLVSTRARAAWAAAMIVIVIVAVVVPALRRQVLGAAFAGALAALVVTPGPTLNWRLPEPYQRSLLSLARIQVGDRTVVWRKTMQLITARPLGFGPGSFENEFAVASKTPTDVSIESPHNEVLRLAFELGLPGLLLCVWLLRWGRRASTRTWLLRASLVALVVCGMTGKTFEEPPTLALACCLVAMVLRRRARRESLSVWGRPMIIASAVSLSVGIVLFDVNQLRASHALARGRIAAALGNPRAAWEQVAPTLADNRELSAWLWAAALLEDAGDASRCNSLIDEALMRYRANPFLLAAQARCKRD